jgi:chitin-binding protein
LVLTFADTGDHTPPGAPSGLTATDVHDFCGGQILSWGASADAVEYEIYLNGRFFDLVGQTTLFAYALGGTNTWTVVAVDLAGNSSAPSNPATLTVVADESLC